MNKSARTGHSVLSSAALSGFLKDNLNSPVGGAPGACIVMLGQDRVGVVDGGKSRQTRCSGLIERWTSTPKAVPSRLGSFVLRTIGCMISAGGGGVRIDRGATLPMSPDYVNADHSLLSLAWVSSVSNVWF